MVDETAMMRARLAPIVLLALILSSCAMNPAAVSHPGAINSFDSNAYDSLVTAQGAIDAAKPLATSQGQKDVLNQVIASYNTCKNAYLLYHTQMVGGGNVDTTQLASQLTALVSASANLVNQIKGTP
jgi:PBP1b-binding outer membrane lipoprotein LpoB